MLATPPLIQLPANAPGKAGEDGPSTWILAAHLENEDSLLDSWVQLGPAQLFWPFRE